jgi:hypothetical protein
MYRSNVDCLACTVPEQLLQSSVPVQIEASNSTAHHCSQPKGVAITELWKYNNKEPTGMKGSFFYAYVKDPGERLQYSEAGQSKLSANLSMNGIARRKRDLLENAMIRSNLL